MKQRSSEGIAPMTDLCNSRLHCEDCDKLLWDRYGYTMNIDTELSNAGVWYGCRGCQRKICDGCAIVYADDDRECLSCERH